MHLGCQSANSLRRVLPLEPGPQSSGEDSSRVGHSRPFTHGGHGHASVSLPLRRSLVLPMPQSTNASALDPVMRTRWVRSQSGLPPALQWTLLDPRRKHGVASRRSPCSAWCRQQPVHSLRARRRSARRGISTKRADNKGGCEVATFRLPEWDRVAPAAAGVPQQTGATSLGTSALVKSSG